MKLTHLPRRTAPLLAGAALLSGCMDLTVQNENTPSVTAAYSDPASLEATVGTSFRVLWGVTQGDRTNPTYPVVALSVLGNELTSADLDIMVVSAEPRPVLDNNDAGGWTNRKPWYDLYEVIATNTDALRVLDEGRIRIGAVSADYPNGRNYNRTRYFAKFNQALAHIYIGLLFDQGYVVDEDIPADKDFFDYELVPSREVLDHGIKLMDEAIALMQAAQAVGTGAAARDTLPETWINGRVVTNLDLIKVANSYVARAHAYYGRNPEQRAAANWAEVIRRVDLGITESFGQRADQNISGTRSSYIQRTQLMTNSRVSNRLVGPADTSGRYQAWLDTPRDQRTDFQLLTPDRRVVAANGTSNGRYFGYIAAQTMPTARGTYMHSRYRGIAFGTAAWNGVTPLNFFIQTMTVKEMDFLKAEAFLRAGRPGDAVTLINKYRTVAANNLPAVTVNGPPPGRACVPKRDDGTCGDLWDALMYEKRIETFGTEAIIPFADARGWGKMLPGSLVEFPVHGRELQTVGQPYYTFGGDLPGSAPATWPIGGKQ